MTFSIPTFMTRWIGFTPMRNFVSQNIMTSPPISRLKPAKTSRWVRVSLLINQCSHSTSCSNLENRSCKPAPFTLFRVCFLYSLRSLSHIPTVVTVNWHLLLTGTGRGNSCWRPILTCPCLWSIKAKLLLTRWLIISTPILTNTAFLSHICDSKCGN